MAVRLFVLIYIFKIVSGKFEGFIVGGDYVRNISEVPWVGFLSFTSVDNKFGCGSSILNQNILITAANCFALNEFYEITASFGHVNKYEGLVHRVAEYKVHNKWDEMTMSYDIALCKLKQSLKFNANVKRLAMVQGWLSEKLDTRKAELAGWGVVEEIKFKDMKMLKSVVQEMWTRKECDAVLYNLPEGTLCGGEEKGKDFVSSYLSLSFLRIGATEPDYISAGFRWRFVSQKCHSATAPGAFAFANIEQYVFPVYPTTATQKEGYDFDRGDGGSGLVFKRRTICGVYSYKDIQVSRSMAVYTNVSHFYDWVASNVKRLECD